MRLSDKYSAKVDALWNLCDILDIEFNDLISELYGSDLFTDSEIKKIEVFAKLYHTKKIEDSVCNYIISRLANKGLDHHKDSRTFINYATDLFLGWLSEDIVVSYMRNKGIKVILSGRDKNRELLSGRYVFADPDFKILIRNLEVDVEFMIDWNNHWKSNLRCDVRSSKIDKLIRNSGIFLGLDANTGMCIISKFENGLEHEWEFIESHQPYGGKSVWRIKCLQEHFVPMESVAKLLLSE